MAELAGGGAGSGMFQTSVPAPMSPMSLNGMPVIPVAGVTADALVDTFGAARDGGARVHKGIDIFAPTGTPVIAATGGTVIKAGDDGGKGGLRVWVQGADGQFHYYAHLSAVNVAPGMQVAPGQLLGRVGNSGNAASTPAHLHYSVNTSPDGESGHINPYQYLKNGVATPMPVDGDPATMYSADFFRFMWQPAALSLDSDDYGSLDPMSQGESIDDVIEDMLWTVSTVMAGGAPIDADQFAAPIDIPVVEGEGGEPVMPSGSWPGPAGVAQPYSPGNTGNPDRDWIIARESDGLPTADNPKSTAFGIGQLLEDNRNTYASRFGFDPNTTDPWQQIQMMDAYVADRYGSYAAARQFHEQNGWY